MSDEAKAEKTVEEVAPIKWNCEIPTIVKETPWTVGQKHTLSCRGESVEQLKEPVKVIIKVPEKVAPQQIDPNQPSAKKQEDPNKDYALFILETKNLDNDSGDFVVTSYKPGKYKDVSFKLVGADKKEILINPMSWNVTTVITNPKTKGFGPTAPLTLGLPWFYWATIIAIVAVVVSLLALKIYFFLRWQKQVKEMKSFATAIGPVNQFYKDIRGLHGQFRSQEAGPLTPSTLREYWGDLEEKFKLYIVRQFEVPAYALSSGKILKRVHKKSQKYWSPKLNGKLKRILAEFKKGHTAQALNIEDVTQMERICQEFVEQIKKITTSRRAN